jgi:LAO/AO transport system kinase
MEAAGQLQARRRAQQVIWMRVMLEERLTTRLRSDPAIRRRLRELEAEVAEGRLAPVVAAEDIAAAMGASR